MNEHDKFEKLDVLHENAKELSNGNAWSYLAIMITELIVMGIMTTILKTIMLFNKLFNK